MLVCRNFFRFKNVTIWTIVLLLISSLSCSAPNTGSSDGSDNTTFAYPGVPPEVGWWHDAVFYEIFVRSFADSNGDGIGDFRGLTEKLDYLNDGDPKTSNDLGINAVWLMPVFSSPSYHGYDVVDYKAVEPDYGSLKDFDAFVRAAHERGIRVILDYVPNHASSQHPLFVSSKNRNSPDRDKFIWRDVPPEGWNRPWDGQPVWYQAGDAYYYGLFWSGMPDWNLANPNVEAMHLDNMRFWMKRGIDGFRIDAARHFFESEDGVLVDQALEHPFRIDVPMIVESDEKALASVQPLQPIHVVGQSHLLALLLQMVVPGGPSQTPPRHHRGIGMQQRLVALIAQTA